MKILFVTSTRIGDAILSTGLLEHLRTKYTKAEVTIACGPAAAPLFECYPSLKKIIVLDKMVLSLHWLYLWAHSAGAFWDMIIDLRDAPITRVLFSKNRHTMRRVAGVQRRIEQISSVLGLKKIVGPKLWTNSHHEKMAEELIPNGRSVLAIGPTANWKAKTWRPEYFLELITRLIGSNGIFRDSSVMLLGRDDERPLVLGLINSIPADRLIDLVGRVDLLTASACLKRSEFYIGNDSGLMHLAAASGVPTLGLFGPTREDLYAPWGENASFVRTTIPFNEIFPSNFEHRNSESLMDSLSVDMVENATQRLWDRKNGSKNA